MLYGRQSGGPPNVLGSAAGRQDILHLGLESLSLKGVREASAYEYALKIQIAGHPHWATDWLAPEDGCI